MNGIIYESASGATHDMTGMFSRLSWKRKGWETRLLKQMLNEMCMSDFRMEVMKLVVAESLSSSHGQGGIWK